MCYASNPKATYVRLVAAILIMLGSTVLAQSNKKSSPPPPAKSAPAKPASQAPSRPSGGSGSSAGHGSSIGGGSHHGSTTSNPRGPTGPRANSTTTVTTPTKGPVTGSGSAPKSVASVAPLSNGAHRIQTKTGNTVQTRSNHKVSDVHDAKRGMDIHHSINGRTRVSVERPDHSRVVAERGRPGYVQHGYMHNGHAYAARNYYYNGRSYTRFYRDYPYRGVYLNVYAPGYYYAPGFYGWAYNPWYSPVYYSWGWAGNPWYGYYGYYFAPSPFYPSASLWLTDYMISSDLSAAYQEQQAQSDGPTDQQASTGTPALSQATKDMIAAEVKNQLALENQEAQQNSQNQEPDPTSSSIARLLSDHSTHIFVVGTPIDAVDAYGAECALSDGDVLNMVAPSAPDATTINLVVLSSKGSRECAKSDTVTVAIADLQDMQNHMRETIDQGLQELQSKQGQSGLPSASPAALTAPVSAGIAKDAPQPEPNGAAIVNQQLADASQAENEVVAQARQETAGISSTPSPSAGTAATTPRTPSIALGQSTDEVTATLGNPLTVIDLGPKKIYKYKDMKITFKDGKVADVE